MDPIVFSVASALASAVLRRWETSAGQTRPLLDLPSGGLVPSGGLASLRSITPPPDLDIQVDYQQGPGSGQLNFTIHSPSGRADYHHHKLEPKVLTSSPQDYADRLVNKIEAIRERKTKNNVTSAQEELKQLGRELYDELFPRGLKEAYLKFRATIESLQITSNEPWIPWEIVSVYEDELATTPVDDDPLCIQFSFTRWVSGQVAPKPFIEIASVAMLATELHKAGDDLPAVGGESKYVADLAIAQGLRDMSANAVETLLRGDGIDLWHFATHGRFDSTDPADARLTLPNGEDFRAADLSGERRTRLRADRPMVVLNACDAGKMAPGLTSLGGWAKAWVLGCHACAFIGPLWQVSDEAAFSFISNFYDALLADMTIGQAVRASRVALRARDAADPTWLAYSVYAHPNAHVRFHSYEPNDMVLAG